jgi:hypothetical protein
MAAKKPPPKTGKTGRAGKAGTGGAAGGTGGVGGVGGTTGGIGGRGGPGGPGPQPSQRLTMLIILAVLAVGVISTMVLFLNNKIERSLDRLGTAIGEIRDVQVDIQDVLDDTEDLKAALDLAERQRQAQAKRIMQLIKALREADVEVPPLPKDSSALSLGPVSVPGNGGASPKPTPTPGAPPPAQPPPGSPPNQPTPQPTPTPSPTATCFDPPSPIAGPICIGAP